MAIVWSVGGVCSGTGRKVFDDLFRETLLGTIQQDSRWPLFVAKNPLYDGDCLRDRHVIDSIPESGMVFDYRYNTDTWKWEGWMSKNGKYSVPKGLKFAEIIVPTIDTTRNEYLVKLMIFKGETRFDNG